MLGECVCVKKNHVHSSSIWIKCSSKWFLSLSPRNSPHPSYTPTRPPQHLPPSPPRPFYWRTNRKFLNNTFPPKLSTNQLYQPTHHLMGFVYLATNLPTLNYPNDPKCTRLSMEVTNTWAWPRLWPCSRNQTNSSLAKRKASGGKGGGQRFKSSRNHRNTQSSSRLSWGSNIICQRKKKRVRVFAA